MASPCCRVMVATMFLLGPSLAAADVVRLKNGGELRGAVETSVKERTVVRTLSGSTVTVPASAVDFVVKRSASEEEYETRLAASPGNAEAHWQLAEWCRTNKLRRLRTSQLKQVLLRDPNHKKARRLLGYVQQDDMSWMTRDQVYWRRGYVKGARKFITRQERDSIAKSQSERDAEAVWSRRINRLSDMVHNGDPQMSAEAIGELGRIVDPTAISALTAYFRTSASAPARLAMIRSLSRIPHPGAVPPLIDQAVFDASPDVRRAAMAALPESTAETATELLSEYLNHHDNVTVNRAAEAMGMIGHPSATKPLSEALTTLHEYSARVSTAPEALQRAAGLTERSDLTPAQIVMVLQAGLIPRRAANATTEDTNGMTLVTYPHRNAGVRAALLALSEKGRVSPRVRLQLHRAVGETGGP